MKIMSKAQLKRKKEFRSIDGRMQAYTALDKVKQEIDNWSTIDNGSCLNLIECLENDETIILVTDYMSGGAIMEWDNENTVYLWKDNPARFPEMVVRCFVHDILVGLKYLHENNIAHRDIKPENLLIGDNGRIKIGDFGVSEKMNQGGKVTKTEGTYHFLPPECCSETVSSAYEGHDGRAADLWALGVTVWALLWGTPLFMAENLQDLFEKIAVGNWVFPEKTDVAERGLDDVSKTLQDFLSKILTKDPINRLTASDGLEHEWMKNVDYEALQWVHKDMS
eukprot:Filipodium_phascolosomae@DN8243_c0_g1_i1.p1